MEKWWVSVLLYLPTERGFYTEIIGGDKTKEGRFLRTHESSNLACMTKWFEMNNKQPELVTCQTLHS